MAVAVIAYLVIGLMSAFADLRIGATKKGALNFGSPLQQMLGLMERSRARGGVRERLRRIAIYILAVPRLTIIWPYSVIVGIAELRRDTSRRHFLARLQLRPTVLLPPLVYFIASTVLLALRLLGGDQWPIELGAAAVVVAVLSTLVTYFLIDEGVARAVRRTLMPPYAQFLTAAALYYLSLLILSILLEKVGARSGLSTQAVLNQVRTLNAFSHIAQSIRTANHTPTALLLTLTGVIYFATFGKLLLQHRSFRRRPEDHASLLTNLLYAGDFRLAQKRLESLPSQTLNAQQLLPVRAQLLCHSHDFSGASKLIKLLVELNPNEVADNSREYNFLVLTFFAKLAPLPDDDYWELIRYFTSQHVSDAFINTVFLVIAGTMEKPWTVDQSERYGITASDYPTTHALLRWFRSEETAEEEAEADLAALEVPGSQEAALRLESLIRIHLYHRRVPRQYIEQLSDLLISEGKSFPTWFKLELRPRIVEPMNDSLLPADLRTRLVAALDIMLRDLGPELLRQNDEWIKAADFVARES